MMMIKKTLTLRGLSGWTGGLWLLLVAGANAGSLDAPAAPSVAASAMFTMTDLYNRLNAGTPGTKRSGPFAEPTAGPGATGYTLDQIMALMPVVDDANGATTANVMSGKTFWGLTSGTWGPRTGTLVVGTAPVPRTGQTICYDAAGTVISSCAGTGQDGALLKGVALPTPRFTDNSNGTVTDNLTGLIWLTNANCANDLRDWATALTDVASLNSSGSMNSNDCGDISNGGSHQTDWRLPNRRELSSLTNDAYGFPGLSDAAGTGHFTDGDPFTNVQSNFYWTSTTFAAGSGGTTPASAWFVNLTDGTMTQVLKTDLLYVWPVRGGL